MAKAGDTIESPPTGACIRFLKTARDTNGQLLQIDDVMKGGGHGAYSFCSGSLENSPNDGASVPALHVEGVLPIDASSK